MDESPATQAIREIQTVFDVFNRELFGDSLPQTMLTLQRQSSRHGSGMTFGFYRQRGYKHRRKEKTFIDEIAVNPAVVTKFSVLEVLQTLAHEMCHQWQTHHGKPSRPCYHNAEWAGKMKAVGLQPSDTGKPGGKETGQHMADYAIEGGRFMTVCQRLFADGFDLTWGDSIDGGASELPGENAITEGVDGEGGENGKPSGSRMGKRVKYSCPNCGVNVWGKVDLNIICGDCESPFERISIMG